MSKPKTLVIISPGFPADEDDSTCIPSQQLFVRALQKQRPDINLVILSFQYPFTAREYVWHGIPVIALGGKNESKLHRLVIWQKAWRALRKINSEHNITGMVSWWLGDCALIGSRFSKKYNIKHYSWILGQDARPGNKYVKWIKPKAEWLIGLSDSLAKEFEANYGLKPKYVMPLGTDISGFEKASGMRDIDMMGAGYLIPLKQYHLFVEAVKRLTVAFPNIKTMICGNGPQMKSLKEQVSRLGLEDNVILKGEISHRATLALMQRSKIFLHTSMYEGFGTVLCEGLYGGAHVISLVSPMEVMPPQFHKADNVDDIVQIATRLLSDKTLDHNPVWIFPVAEMAGQIAALFD
jgi:glycosyltransferase involved in cell wall biosynthesis